MDAVLVSGSCSRKTNSWPRVDLLFPDTWFRLDLFLSPGVWCRKGPVLVFWVLVRKGTSYWFRMELVLVFWFPVQNKPVSSLSGPSSE